MQIKTLQEKKGIDILSCFDIGLKNLFLSEELLLKQKFEYNFFLVNSTIPCFFFPTKIKSEFKVI